MTKRPTIKDVARQAGVSKSTVSRVIAGNGQHVSEQNRLRVEQAIEELQYVRNTVASSMRTQRTNTIMLAIPDITNPFWPAVARGVQDVMDQEGIAVVFANSDWNVNREARFLETTRSNLLDGLLINPVGVTEKELKALRIPTVLLGVRANMNMDMVGTDNREGIKQALNHLVSLGHRQIGFILGKREGQHRNSRLPFYLEVLGQAGVKLPEEMILMVPFRQQAGQEAMQQLLALRRPPTAVFCENDLLAIGAIQATHACGLSVPGDVSVIGVDDIFAASTTMPALSTVAKPKYEYGTQAARLLIERMQSSDSGSPRTIRIACKLLLRDSTGPPRS